MLLYNISTVILRFGKKTGQTDSAGRCLTHGLTKGKKRKREVLQEGWTDSAAEYDTSAITSDGIEISEVDPKGRFVRLQNKSNEVRKKVVKYNG